MPFASAHLLDALLQVGSLQQDGVIQASPYLIKQVAIFAVIPQFAQDMTHEVDALRIQQEPWLSLSDCYHSLLRPRSYGFLAQAKQPGRYDGPDRTSVDQRGTRNLQQPGPAFVVFGQRTGDVLNRLSSIERASDALLLDGQGHRDTCPPHGPLPSMRHFLGTCQHADTSPNRMMSFIYA